jgi:superfamily I DNA/RNA helicase
MFTPSKYQTAIFDFVAIGAGDAVVDAVPGSGKTTTCVEASKHLNARNVLFCAFNRHIAAELKTQLQGMRAQTIHSLGLSALSRLGRPNVDDKKYTKLIREYVIDKGITEKEALRTAIERIRSLLRLAQLTLTNPDDESALKVLGDRFDLDCKDWEFTWRAISPILYQGIDLAYQVINYNDMVWLPHMMNLAPRAADWVFVDEAQDLNQAQLELVLKARARGGRMLFVGDKRQAIYAFSGACSESIANIIERTQATVLPLSICYRCPTSHIELANEVYPGIEPRPRAPKGIVRHIDEVDILGHVADGDLIICRTNAPLVTVCFKLIRAGIPAQIRGTDIGKNLVAILNQLEEAPGFQFSRLTTYLNAYLDEQRQLRQGRDRDEIEMALANLQDRVDTILAIYRASRTRTMPDLIQAITDLFSDQRAKVWLSSIHKAKGLEAQHVILLHPHRMPHPKAKKPWEKEQEMNLKYVALTRAKECLTFAHGEEDEA